MAPGVRGRCAAPGKRVIAGQLRKCAETGDLVVPAELAYSEYSSRPVKRTLLRASEKAPGRLGTKGELGACDVTGKHLLLDELGRCAVSKGLVDRDLLVTCGLTGDQVLKTES